jgi:hypothetical protein
VKPSQQQQQQTVPAVATTAATALMLTAAAALQQSTQLHLSKMKTMQPQLYLSSSSSGVTPTQQMMQPLLTSKTISKQKRHPAAAYWLLLVLLLSAMHQLTSGQQRFTQLMLVKLAGRFWTLSWLHLMSTPGSMITERNTFTLGPMCSASCHRLRSSELEAPARTR